MLNLFTYFLRRPRASVSLEIKNRDDLLNKSKENMRQIRIDLRDIKDGFTRGDLDITDLAGE